MTRMQLADAVLEDNPARAMHEGACEVQSVVALSNLATTPAVTALARHGRGVVIAPLGFARVTQLTGLAGEWSGFVQRDFDARIDEDKAVVVRRLFVELIRLVANGVAPAALQAMPVVVQHLAKWPFVNDRLVALK